MANTNDDVIIVGSLSDNEMRKAIDDLVSYVGDQTTLMAGKFTKSIDLMRGAMKDFAVTQKVSVDLMKQAWREMSSSFDAMVAAQSQSTGGSGVGSGGSNATPNTVKELKDDIAAAEKMRDTLQQWSPQLYAANEQIEKMRNNLNSMLVKGTLKEKMADARKELGDAISMPTKNLGDAQQKLATLEALQQKYKNTTQLSVQQTNRLATAIQTCKDKIDKLTKTKPQKLSDVLGMDESSVDAIAKKMQALKRVSIDPKNTAQVRELGNEYQRLSRLQAELLGKGIQLTKSNNYLAQSFGYIRNRIVYALTLGAATQFVKKLYEIRSEYELLERSLGVLVGSFQKGNEVFRELSDMALKSPFTLMELAGAAKQLTAYNFAEKEVVETTRRLADISAALGVPMERLTYNLGQIRAQTVLNARDARDFANAGLPIVKSLADYYTEIEGKLVSTGDVYDRMSKKMVSYNDVMAVLVKMTDEGGKFFDFQAKQADTLRVQLANLTLAYNNMMNEIGKSNQGLLSAPIKGLKLLFENWRELSSVLTALVISYGLAKTANYLFGLSLSKTTIETIKQIGAIQGVTAADYENIIVKGKLTATQAKYLIATNKNNLALRAQIVMAGILTQKEAALAATSGRVTIAWNKMKIAATGVANAVKGLGASFAALAPQMAAMLAISAIVDIFAEISRRSEAIEEFGNTLRRNAEENAKSIEKLLDSYKFNGASELSEQERIKAWKRMREEIELTTASSEKFISVLLQEDNMENRVDKAREMLRKIQQIHEIMMLWNDDAIDVTQNFKVLGLGADGLTEDLKDFVKALNASSEPIENVDEHAKGLEGTWRHILSFVYDYNDLVTLSGYNYAKVFSPFEWAKWLGFDENKNEVIASYKELESEMQKFTDSLAHELKTQKVTDPFQIKEALDQTLKDAAEQGNWTQQQLLNARVIAEKQFREKYKRSYELASEDDKKVWEQTIFGKNAAWESWMAYLMAHHRSDFESMAKQEVKQSEWAGSEREKKYKEAFEEFKKQNALAAKDVEDHVYELNQLQVHIKVFYDEPESLSKVEEDFRARTGYLENSEYFRNYAKGANTQVEVVDKLKKAQKEKAEEEKRAREAGGKYSKENLARIKQENQDLINMIHAYKALTDEEEKRKKKKGKDLVLEALKQEISLVEKLRSDYDKLTKSGATQADALYTVRSAYNKTINQLNEKLKGFGLPQINLNELIVGKDPNKQLEHYRKTLTALTQKGLLNVDRAKEVEAVIEKLVVSAKTYNFDKITKSLNNELDKLKEEYELAVELDANPELGGLFADWMGISMEDLPRTVEEVTKRAQNIVDKAIGELNKKWIDAGATISNTLKGNADIMFSHIVEEEKLIEKGWDGINNKLSSINTKEYTIKDVSGKERTITVTPVLPNGEILTPKELDDYVQKTIEGSLVDKKEIIQTVGIKLTDDANVESLIEKIKSEVNDIPKEKVVEILTSYETKKPDAKVLEKSIRRMMDYKMPSEPSVETDDNMKKYTKDLETYENKVKAVTDTIYQWIEAQHKARLQGALVTVVENSTTTTNKTDNVTEETLLLNGFTEEEIQRLKKGKIAISDVAKAMRIVGEHKDFDETKRSVVNLIHAFGDTKNVDELNNKLLLMQDFLLSMQGEKVVVETGSKKNIVNVSEKREVKKNITDNIREETLKVHGLTDNDIKNLKQGKIAIEDVEGALDKGKQLFDDYSKGVLTFEELTDEIKKMAVLTDGIDFGSEDSINEYAKKLNTIYHYLVEITDVANKEISITINNRDALGKVGEVLSKLNGVNEESQINLRLNVNDKELDALRNAFINDESVNISTTSLKDDTGFQQIVIDVDNKEALQRVNEIVKKVVDLRNYTNLNISMNVDDAQLEDIKQLIPTSESINFDVDANVSNSVEEILSLDKKKIVVDVDADAKSKNVLQEIANLYAKAKEGGFIPSTKIDDIMNIDLEKWAESNNIEIDAKTLEAFKKVQSQLRDIRKKEIQETSSNWNKLLEKYSEYEYKLNQIAKTANKERLDFIKKMGTDEQKVQATTLVPKIDAEKDPSKKEELTNQLKQITTEIAGSDAAKIQITTAIDTRELQESARLSFEEFQKTPEWITATGNLADMSTDAIKSLIGSINDYKKNAKNLSPKQIKQMNQALKQLHAEQRKNNPFKAIITMIDESKERMANFDEEIGETEKEIEKLQKKKKENIVDGIVDEETDNKLKKAIKRLEELRKKREESGGIDATSWVSSINETISAIGGAVGVFNDLAKAIDGVENSDFDKTMNVLTQAGNAAATGAMIGGKWGAIIGAVVGAATSVIGMISESGNEAINDQIKSSELAVKRLELAYIDLQKAVDKAYGTSVIGAKTAAAAAKKLELQELERQLRLERSRDSKHRDEDRIIELQKQIKELKYEIQDTYTEIVNDLMGTDVGSFAENLVSAMVDAFKQGEDAMKVFNDKFDELIDNMIMKSLMSRIVSSYIDKLWEDQETKIKARSKKESDDLAKAQAEYDKVKNMGENEWLMYHYGTNKFLTVAAKAADESGLKGEDLAYYLKNLYDKRMEALEASVDEANKALSDATAWTSQDIKDVMSEINSMKGGLYDDLMEGISQWYTFGQDSDKTLSALQQGIQGITEDTAGAIEAYLNSVSQQVYLHSEILTEIKGMISNFDFDTQLGLQAQMLLQLQNSYTVQKSIESILSGVLNPSGRAFSVELIS